MKRLLVCMRCMLCGLLFLAGAGCSETDEDLSGPGFSVSELLFDSGSSMRSFEIRAIGEWSLAVPEWGTCSPQQGTGNTTVSITVKPNTGAKREGTVTVTADGGEFSIAIVQEGADFSMSLSKIEFDEAGTPVEVLISSKTPWTLDFGQVDWLTAVPAEGEAGETVVEFTPKPVTSRDPRIEALVKVVYGPSGSSYLIVEQTMPNEAPTAPMPLSPAEGAADVPVNALFSWQEATDPDGDRLAYEVQVSFDGGATWPFVTATSATETQLDQLLHKKRSCQWRVKVTDPFGGEVVSAPVSFRTGERGGLLDGEVYEWQHESAGAPHPVHLVFTGDGFIPADWAEGGAFEQMLEKTVEAIFAVEPYRSYRNYFRISVVGAHSKERGATVQQDMGYLGPGAQKRNTKFSTTLAGGGDTFVDGNDNLVWTYAKKVPGIDDVEINNTSVFILINVDAYAGTCHAYSKGRSACYCPLGTMSMNGRPVYEAIIVHEGAGHGFGCLQDEYRYYNEPIDSYSRMVYERFRQDNPLSSWNVSLTGDRELVHWNHYFTRPGYEAVGMYEGAMLFTLGVWRPEVISCMEDNRPYFNAPSREVIVRRICKIAGIEFDLEAFVERDLVRSDPTTRARAASRVPELVLPPLAPPVLIVED